MKRIIVVILGVVFSLFLFTNCEKEESEYIKDIKKAEANLLNPIKTDFSVSSDNINLGTYIYFTSYSFYENDTTKPIEIVKWLWDFGDGNTSTEANPYYKYTSSGTYDVKLTVTDVNGFSGTEEKLDFIRVTELIPPSASFQASSTYTSTYTYIYFTDYSSGDVTSWYWDFGDGSTSTYQNPSHYYYNSGYYTVKLTASGPAGSDTETRYDYIYIY